MTLLIQYTIIFASVLLLVALGGCFSERSGVINIGLEGIMVIGALGGALVMKFLPVSVGAPVMVLTVILASAAAGLLYSLLLAVASITFRADQTITGTAMNLLATAAATVAVKAMEHVDVRWQRRFLRYLLHRAEEALHPEHRQIRVQLVHAGCRHCTDRLVRCAV